MVVQSIGESLAKVALMKGKKKIVKECIVPPPSMQISQRPFSVFQPLRYQETTVASKASKGEARARRR